LEFSAPDDRVDTAGPPEGASAAERWALRALQLGAVAVVLAAVTDKAHELDRFFVPKEFILHLTAVAAGILAFLVWAAAGALWSPRPVEQRPAVSRIGGVFLLLLVLAAAYGAVLSVRQLAAMDLYASVSIPSARGGWA
jgi:hypothetical protein